MQPDPDGKCRVTVERHTRDSCITKYYYLEPGSATADGSKHKMAGLKWQRCKPALNERGSSPLTGAAPLTPHSGGMVGKGMSSE